MANFRNQFDRTAPLLWLCVALFPISALTADEEVLIIEDELVIDEGTPATPAGELLIIDDQDNQELLIEEGSGSADKSEPGQEILIETNEQPSVEVGDRAVAESSNFSLKLDELWGEYGVFTHSASDANGLGYLHGQATALWTPSSHWDLRASVRLDGYSQHGNRDWDHADLDYDETFIRYRSDNFRLTAGAQKIVWGRIDEFPPTDRLSTHDLSRYIMDDLADRRRASAAIRYEHFFGEKKLDVVFLPWFREAELPGASSVWFPVNRQSGQILGLNSTPASVALIKSAPVDVDASNSDGGFGIRYSGTGEGMDYALTVQKVRQSLPYFNYNSTRGVLEAKYPRSWVLGGDVGVEAMGAIWRFEAGWMSDAPVTRIDGSYATVNSLNWGAGVEFFPGDGDARVNLQLTGINHDDAPAVIDRTEIYLFGGSFEVPFAQDQWRLKGRFYKGLDTHDLYLNPELAYTGWESQEVYLEAHYFEGAAGTPGAFHQDNSILAVGWRAKF
ncbi:hypothetical protein [Sedimenticola selenatireducens]|uniref:hypothetical protein n=1 Tax=Sedimenticola selenatireducens TaxID=191960 RepID=UPI002AABDF70|nr:hypothetical protein [Sedimenticola selenatireducens]